MERIVPFTESATEHEAEAMYLLMFAQALYKQPLSFNSIENYNEFMDANMTMLDETLDSPEDAVQVDVMDDEVTFSLSDEFHRALEQYKDEHGPVDV